MKLLIIEDNKDLQGIYQHNFQAAGHTVAVADNGLDGLNVAVEFQPDIVLLDIMTPEMDGYGFLTALHNNTSLTPFVVACSNISQADDIEAAKQAGAEVFLRKSDYVGAELIKAVEEAYAARDMQPKQIIEEPAPIDDEQF